MPKKTLPIKVQNNHKHNILLYIINVEFNVRKVSHKNSIEKPFMTQSLVLKKVAMVRLLSK